MLLQPKTVPKTSSGKIARARCRKGFLDKSLQTIYSKSFVGTEQENKDAKNKVNLPPLTTRAQVDPATIRKLSKKQILKKVLDDVAKYVPLPPASISKNDDLSTMMDSLTLSQFKGQLQYEYATNVSDGYLFRPGTTINKLVDVIKLGYAPDDSDESPAPGGVAIGQQEGLAGALGCPPGVKICCAVM